MMTAAVSFVHRLRRAGLEVPTGATLAFTDALAALPEATVRQRYWAGRSTLVVRHEDIPVYDAVFADSFRPVTEFAKPEHAVSLAIDADDAGDDAGNDDDDSSPSDEHVLRFSAVESLRTKDFAQYTDVELLQARRLMHHLRLAGPPRRSNRLQRSRRRHTMDLRATMRASLRAAGEPLLLHWRAPGIRLRRIVLLLDVSGSMETYARAFLRFTHAAVAGRQRVEAFTLGTRLTRITRELSTRDPDLALQRAGHRVEDWSGGTRLGDCIREFNDRWGVRGMARGAIVIVLSDGWDRGDPEVLGTQMARLRRVAARVVWVNPLKVTPGYAPLARGMAAALEHVDDFVEGHSLRSLEQLVEIVNDDGAGRRDGRAVR